MHTSYIHTHIHPSIHAYIHKYVCRYLYLRSWFRICVIHMYKRTYVCKYVYVYVYIYVCVCVCICICICIGIHVQGSPVTQLQEVLAAQVFLKTPGPRDSCLTRPLQGTYLSSETSTCGDPGCYSVLQPPRNRTFKSQGPSKEAKNDSSSYYTIIYHTIP